MNGQNGQNQYMQNPWQPQPQMGQPQMGQPQMGQPQMGQPQPQMGQPQPQPQMGQPQPQMGQPQPQMVTVAPANLPGNRRYDFQIHLNEVKEKIENGMMKGYVISYDFKVISGEYTGFSTRQWFPTYAATSKLRDLFKNCGRSITTQQGPNGASEALDPTAINGALINAELTYDGNDFARLSDIKPVQQGQQQVQQQPQTPGGFGGPVPF